MVSFWTYPDNKYSKNWFCHQYQKYLLSLVIKLTLQAKSVLRPQAIFPGRDKKTVITVLLPEDSAGGGDFFLFFSLF